MRQYSEIDDPIMNNSLNRFVPRAAIKHVLPRLIMAREAKRHGLRLTLHGPYIEIARGDTALRLSSDHAIYLRDAIRSFDYYVSAVVPLEIDGRRIVDYSTPRYHDVVGFDAYPVLFPSLAEPVVTAAQISTSRGSPRA
jgi:hypothetical protein